MKLTNKVALITGAGSGIGREIALKFAQNNAVVVITDINQIAAENTAQEIKTLGGEALALTMDVVNEDTVEQVIKKIINVYSHIDILISNAGVQHIEALEQITLENWKKVLSIHLDGAFLTTRACLREMYKSGRGGKIIYIGSVHSKEASILKAPYVTAKHGLIGLCKVVAKEGAAHNVVANVICPGFVLTPLVKNQIPEQANSLKIHEADVIKNMLKGTVDNQFTSLEDIAEATLFLASFKTNALTGQSLIVSHGWHME